MNGCKGIDEGLSENAQKGDDRTNGIAHDYLTTDEAARYMRRSTSWLLRQKDIPYYRGKPNLYHRHELDDWFNKHRRFEPLEFRGLL